MRRITHRGRGGPFALLAALTLLGPASAFATSAPKVYTPLPPLAVLPPQLQALEQKMQQLNVTSERYTATFNGSALVHVGKRTKRKQLQLSLRGEADLSSQEGQILDGSTGAVPGERAIGSALYVYSSKIAKKDGGKPWVRIAGSPDVLFPFHGGANGEAKLGGTGSYAGLFNVMSTAVGAVESLGVSTVDGQQASEFALTVEPVGVVDGLGRGEREAHHETSSPQKLDVFLTEAGMPVRVVEVRSTGLLVGAETTDITAVNVPVSVQRPSAKRTITSRQAERYGSGQGESQT